MIDESFGLRGPSADEEDDAVLAWEYARDEVGDLDAYCENLREERRIERWER